VDGQKAVNGYEECYDRWGSDFLEYRDAAGHVADFHALRHTYISRLVRSGANVKVAQELARHSTPTLTLGRYAHMGLLDQTKALDALPSIDQPVEEREVAKATGTYDAAAGVDDVAQARSAGAARRTPGTSKLVITGQDTGVENDGQKVAQTSIKIATCHDLAIGVTGAGGRTRTDNHRFTKPGLCH